MNKNKLRKILQEVIQEQYDFENEEGDIMPERMKDYDRYCSKAISALEYWHRWPGLTYDFISDQVSREVGRKSFDPDMFERAIYGLISNEEIIEFKGMWNTMQDPPGFATGKRVQRTLYKLPEDHQWR